MLDKNGYAPSVVDPFSELDKRCFLCNYRGDLVRHEIFNASNRQKSKAYGLWVTLCHEPCHLGKDGYQYSASKARGLKAYGQIKAMEHYGWNEDEFRQRFGKSYIHTDFEGRDYE